MSFPLRFLIKIFSIYYKIKGLYCKITTLSPCFYVSPQNVKKLSNFPYIT
nr:MAG TPA: hypothetical protein [Caudoviricetes sp.]